MVVININIAKKTKIIGIILCIIISITFFFYKRGSNLFVFVKENPSIEIHSSFDALANVEEIRGGNIKEVNIDDSRVNTSKVGKYPVIYSYNEKSTKIIVTVIDTKPPSFEVKEIEIDLGMKVVPENLVENVKDDSLVDIYFAKEYSFKKVGDINVKIIAEDESGNKSEKETTVRVLTKDKVAPKLTGVKDIYVQLDANIDFLVNVKVNDNRDPNPQIEMETKGLNTHVIGSYPISYIAKDRSGNSTKILCEVHVMEHKEIGTTTPSDEKVIYLTFDDGPSKYTKKILDILDRYNAKATFFVTGGNPEYFGLIKEANDRGHTIGLHTYSHDYEKIYSSSKEYYKDLDKIANLCKEQIGYIPKYIRFPGGSSNEISRKYNVGIMSFLSKDVLKKGYQYYDWDISSSDGEGSIPVQKIIMESTMSKDTNISILCHDANGKETTVQALPAIIEYYQSLGYRFGAISDNSYVCHHTIHN